MHFNKKAFVIVDGYSTGRFLAPCINAHGYSNIHVQSSKNIIPAYFPSFTESNFIKNIAYDGDISPVLDYLEKFEIMAVIPGTETGVHLADLLSNALGLNSANSLQLSIARRNKFDMVNCLASHHIPHANSFQSNNLNEIIKWVNEYQQFPVVVKPLSSAGSDGVKICNNIAEITDAFNGIINISDIFNEINTIVMVQQYLDGQEYIVNTVSQFGEHVVVDIWRKFKNKIEGIPINEYAEIVDPSERAYAVLTTYVFKVLNALEMKFGAGHSEVMMTQDGPVLIETAARLEGSIDPSAVNEAVERNQVKCLVDSYINKAEFLQTYSTANAIKKYARHTFLAASCDGEITKQPDLQPIINLPSFHSLSFRFELGDIMVKTTSLADFPGFVYLVSEDKQQVEKDYEILREYEKTLYSDMRG